MNQCKNCKYFKRYTGEYDNNNYGRCQSNKLQYGETTKDGLEVYDETDKLHKIQETDYLVYMDCEGYNAEIEVGQDFGCIHYEEAEKND